VVKNFIGKCRPLFLSVILCGINIFSAVYAAEEEEKDVYLGATFDTAAINVGGESLNTMNMRVRLGLDMFTEIIPMISLESHFGFDLTDDSANINGTDASLHLNSYIGLYMKASHEIEDVVKFYGLVGFAATQLKGDTFVLQDDTVTGLSFGVGAGFNLPFNFEGTVELMQLVNGDPYDVLLFSLGINYRM